MNHRRVVITGIGTASPLGNSPEELYSALRSGKSSIRKMTEWSGRKWNVDRYFGSPVSLPEGYVKSLPRKARRSMCAISHFASYAAQQAVADSGLPQEELSSVRSGCIIGSTMGGSSAIHEAYNTFTFGQGVDELSSMQFFKCASHTAAFNVSHLLGTKGVVISPAAACASSLQAVGLARDLVAAGSQDIVICGGAEELAPEVCVSFAAIFAGVDPEQCSPETCSRPFDAKRCGLVCGEGSGILVLEEYEHARKRGAKIYAEVTGFATNSCAEQISQSDAVSIEECIRAACEDAGGMDGKKIYISAHATSTLQGDAAEAGAIRSIFGSTVPVSSLKGHMGHTLGASGTIELAAALLMMEKGEIIPTLNLDEPGEDCSGIDLPREIRPYSFDTIIKNSFAFGGINAAVICSKIQP